MMYVVEAPKESQNLAVTIRRVRQEVNGCPVGPFYSLDEANSYRDTLMFSDEYTVREATHEECLVFIDRKERSRKAYIGGSMDKR